MASVLIITKGGYHTRSFAWQPHPFVLPSFDNAFSFTITKVAENIVKFLFNIMQVLSVEEEELEKKEEQKMAERSALARRVRDVGRAMLILRGLRKEQEESISPLRLADPSPEMANQTYFERVVAADEANEQFVRSDDLEAGKRPRSKSGLF